MDCLTEEEMDDAVDELVENLEDHTYITRLDNGNVMVVEF